MTFGARQLIKQRLSQSLNMGNSPLDTVQTFKYLERSLDRELKFNPHAQNIYKFASIKVNTFRRIRPYKNEHTALMMYKLKILRYLDNGDSLYMSANEEHLDDIRIN